MSLLEKATLITTPTAHSNGTLHSIKGGTVADFDVARGSAATRVNAEGLVESVAANIPRIDYTTGEGVVLLEPQSTNLVTYSEDFSQWTPVGTPTITSNYGVSPDGATTSSRGQLDADERIASIFSSSGDITFSVYLKGSGVITLRDSTNAHRQDATLTSEWVRYELSFNGTITSVQLQNQTASAVDFEMWGAQAEALSHATSYIPTSGAIATRLADSVTGAGDATTFNSTEGVLYLEMASIGDTGVFEVISLSDGSAANIVAVLYRNTANGFTAVVNSGGATSLSKTITLADATDFIKVAVSYKLNEFKLYVNGVLEFTDTSGNAPVGLNTLQMTDSNGTSNKFKGKIKALAVFNEALTDLELECLTKI